MNLLARCSRIFLLFVPFALAAPDASAQVAGRDYTVTLSNYSSEEVSRFSFSEQGSFSAIGGIGVFQGDYLENFEFGFLGQYQTSAVLELENETLIIDATTTHLFSFIIIGTGTVTTETQVSKGETEVTQTQFGFIGFDFSNPSSDQDSDEPLLPLEPQLARTDARLVATR